MSLSKFLIQHLKQKHCSIDNLWQNGFFSKKQKRLAILIESNFSAFYLTTILFI